MIDHTRSDDLLVPLMSYLSTDPQIFNEEGTYADPDANIDNNTTVEWVHSISSIINGLIAAGMRIDRFKEFDTIDWKALDHMVPAPLEKWALPAHQQGHVPLGFAIEAAKT